MQVQVLGIGNTIRSDDGLGVRVIERLRQEGLPKNITLTDAGVGGAALLDMIEEGDRLIIVDAIISGDKPGTVRELSVEELPSVATAHLVSSHDFDLMTALALAQNVLDKKVPRDIVIIAVEAADIVTFADSCTPEVVRAIDEVVERVKEKCL